MKRELIITTLMVALLALAAVKADDVNMEININGTANLNISIETEDTELREDVYGTEGSSPEEDVVLQYIDEHKDDPNPGWEEMRELCYDPAFADYFTSLSSVPPEGFIEHLKSLGYDDVSHINHIWSMCLEERINDNEEDWSTDTGISQSRVANMIEGAIDWLFGRSSAPTQAEVEIARNLDSYFASDSDAYYLLRRINDLQFRVEALEYTIDEIASEAYCMGKLKVMMDYGLEGVRCDDTTYLNHQFTPTGEEMVIGITPVNGEHEEEEVPEVPEEIPVEEDTEEVLASLEAEEMVLDKTELFDILTMVNSEMDDLTKGVLLVVSTYTLTILTLQKVCPEKKGYVFRGMVSGIKNSSSSTKVKSNKTISILNSKIKKFLINQRYNFRILRLKIRKLNR